MTAAPEICLDVLSPSNSTAEIERKKAAYFSLGAKEVWIVDDDGRRNVFVAP